MEYNIRVQNVKRNLYKDYMAKRKEKTLCRKTTKTLKTQLTKKEGIELVDQITTLTTVAF